MVLANRDNAVGGYIGLRKRAAGYISLVNFMARFASNPNSRRARRALCLFGLAILGFFVGDGPVRADAATATNVIRLEPWTVTETAPVWDNLPPAMPDAMPRTLGKNDLDYGCILYRTEIPAGPEQTLEVSGVYDFGLVFLEGRRVGALVRTNGKYKIQLPAREQAAALDILVEAVGRLNFDEPVHDRKGLLSPVKLGGTELTSWKMFELPLEGQSLTGMKFDSQRSPANTPAFWRTTIEVADPGNLFLDLRSWGKGAVWVNGRFIGRFWNAGPVQTVLVPASALQAGRNEIVILDLLGPQSPVLAGLGQPVLHESHPERDLFHPRSKVRQTLEFARLVQAGQFADELKAQSVKFSTPVKGRYFSLEALSSQDGQPYASVAELDLLDEQGRPLNREDWTVAYVDSEEHDREDGSAQNAFDGRATTHWHTQWGEAAPGYPHRLILDLGRSCVVSGFRYLPRQGDPGAAGRIRNYRVSIGDRIKEELPPLDLLPKQCYLFAHFNDWGADGLHLAWSLDGYQWEPLNGGQSVLISELGPTNLMRDPCLLRAPDGVFHLVWTMAWGGNSIGHATSSDLIHWSAQQAIPVMEAETNTLNCWAPEIYWDESQQDFLLIWASAVRGKFLETLVPGEDGGNQRIYSTTTKDFKTFSPTRLFFDPGFSVIDPTILQARGQYYLFFKDEAPRPAKKAIRYATGNALAGPFGPVSEPFSTSWVEGPAVFKTGTAYLAIYHGYLDNHWGAMRSTDLKQWQDVTDRLKLPPNSHPGTVLNLSREMLLTLWRAGQIEIGPAPEAAALGLGSWIWTDTVEDKQTCRLWHDFTVPSGTLVSQAKLRITADNGYRVFLDGREIGRGGDLNNLTEYELTQFMSPGPHTLAVEGFNDALSAGVIIGLHVQMSNGQEFHLLSDPSWRVVPADEKNWELRKEPRNEWKFARVVGFAGKFDWFQPERIITAAPPPLQPVRFWQQTWFLVLLLMTSLVAAAFAIRQGLKLAVQTRSQFLLKRERDRIARDIQDDIGAGLTQLTLMGELVLRETPPGAEIHGQINSLCGKSRALLGSMDELVWAMNSRRDTVHDFAAFICEHAQEFLNTTPMRCRLDVPDDLPPVPLDLPARRNLLLAVKEAVRNAARHSGGDELCLQVRMEDQNLCVEVADNGKGFTPEAARATRNGLRNMRERLTDIGGTCRLTSVPGQGSRVIFTVPLNPPAIPDNLLSALAARLFRRRPPSEPNT